MVPATQKWQWQLTKNSREISLMKALQLISLEIYPF
jgi:hypothetical protein